MKSMRMRRAVRGISLMEILISLAIGLVVIGAVIVSFVGSGQAGRYQSALTQMNQDAQIGLNLLSREIQLAGYAAPAALIHVNALPGPPVVPAHDDVLFHDLNCPGGSSACPGVASSSGAIFGCDGGTSATSRAPFVNPQSVPLACVSTATPSSSGFGVVYEADALNTVPNSSNVPTDCAGVPLTSNSVNTGAPAGPVTPTAATGGVPFYVARNRYFVDVSTGVNASGRPELYCASDVTAKRPLLENVDDMQIWYGVAANPITTNNATRQVGRYVKAGRSAASPSTINADAAPAAQWGQVIAVRICLLMRSSEPVLKTGGEDTMTYLDCDSHSQTSTDRYLRRAYFTTSSLRARMAYPF